MSDKDELAKVIRRAYCDDAAGGVDVYSVADFYPEASAVLASDWLASRDREVARRAWDEGHAAGKDPRRYGDKEFWDWDSFDATYYAKPGVDPTRVNPYLPPVTEKGADA